MKNFIYHFTDIDALINMVDGDFIFTSEAFFKDTRDSQFQKKRYFYLSFQRTISTEEGYSGLTSSFTKKGNNIRLHFDKSLLKKNYKIIPISFHKISKLREHEDRLVTYKESIPFFKYVKNVDIYMEEKIEKGSEEYEMVKKLQNNDIKVIFFNNWKDFSIRNMKKSYVINISEDEDYKPVEKEEQSGFIGKKFMILGHVVYVLHNENEQIKKFVDSAFQKHYAKYFTKYDTSLIVKDFFESFDENIVTEEISMIPKLFRNSSLKEDRILLKMLFDVLRKHEVTSLKEFEKLLRDNIFD